MSSITRDEQQCGYCSSNSFIQSRGEIVCSQCGTIVERVYTHSSHSMSENAYQGPTQYTNVGKRLDRVGNLGSEIGFYNSKLRCTTDGSKISQETAMKFNRLNVKFHRPSKNASTQTHLRTFSIFNRVASQLQLTPTLKERTSYLYWKYVNNKENKISNHVLLIALCLLYAVRENRDKSPYKFQEIIASFEQGGHRVTNRNILQLAMDLNMNLNKTSVRKSEEYITRLTEKLSTDKRVQESLSAYKNMSSGRYQILLTKISHHLLDTLDLKRRGGVQPFGFAASIVYLADRGIARFYKKTPLLTQSLTAEITGAKEYTIRDHCYKSLSRHFEEQKIQIFSIIKKGIRV